MIEETVKKVIAEFNPAMEGVVFSVGVGISGVIVSFINNDWEWFQRAGSLIVAIGVYVAARDIGSVDRQLKSTIALGTAELINEDKTKILNGKDLSGEDIEAISNKVNDAVYAGLLKFHLKIEATILIVGTIIWGFGDLIGKLFGS